MTICEKVCDGIKDEISGQVFYIELSNKLSEDGYPEESEAVKMLLKDEEKHEDYLDVLREAHNCPCDIIRRTK